VVAITLSLSGTSPSPLVLLATLFLIQSWIPESTYYFGVNGPSWSLSTEAFFYLVFPFAAKKVSTYKTRDLLLLALGGYILVSIITFVTQILLAGGPTIAILYVNPAYRVWEFLLGIFLGVLVKRGLRTSLSVRQALTVAVSVLLLVIAINCILGFGLVVEGDKIRTIPGPIMSLALTPTFALLILAFTTNEISGKPSVMSSVWLTRLGRWSFALYLSHLWLIELISSRFTISAGHPLAIVAFFASAFVAVLFSGLLYQSVEQPLERLLRRRQKAKRATTHVL
jgi:peptidoglycan/LPS O-acetylase OafA/YrhL